MQKLINYEEYLNNGGIIVPEVTSYDKANNITSIEEKFNKWLIYTQIQLNYILQDKLEAVSYNLLNISEPYRRDIINILVIRLNRAFENDRIILRDENTQYSEMGAINWSSMSDQNPYFWNLQELQIVETSGILEVVNLYCDEYTSEKHYPLNLTEEMNNRLLGNETIAIDKIVNPINGLTSLEFSVTEKIAHKSQLDDYATKKQFLKNQNEIENKFKNKLETSKFNDFIKDYRSAKKILDNNSKNIVNLDKEKQTKKDKNLKTNNKTIVEAINEINSKEIKGTLKPYLIYSQDNMTPFFQTFDIEQDPFKGAISLKKWLDTFNNLERTTIFGSLRAYDGNDSNRVMTGTFTYSKLPNSSSTFVIQLTASTKELIRIGVEPNNFNRNFYGIALKGWSSPLDPKNFYWLFEATINEENLLQIETKVWSEADHMECSTMNNVRFQVITIFGNNYGLLGIPKNNLSNKKII